MYAILSAISTAVNRVFLSKPLDEIGVTKITSVISDAALGWTLMYPDGAKAYVTFFQEGIFFSQGEKIFFKIEIPLDHMHDKWIEEVRCALFVLIAREPVLCTVLERSNIECGVTVHNKKVQSFIKMFKALPGTLNPLLAK